MCVATQLFMNHYLLVTIVIEGKDLLICGRNGQYNIFIRDTVKLS